MSSSELCQRHNAKALSFYNELRSCEDPYIRDSINNALDALSDALRLYGPNQLLSSYNGGKDADIVMHLLRAAIAKFSLDNNTIFVPKLVYFSVDDEFPEILEHIALSEQLFDLQLKRYSCGILEGIKQHAEANKGSAPAFVLGTRRGDPNCGNQETFAPSSSWMPVAFMRVNPILSWSYGQVWHFLRLFNLPYCKLYDDGYTSMGQQFNTLRNPYLRKTDVNGTEYYWPAYLLVDWDQERAGRISKSKLTVSNRQDESTDESATPIDEQGSTHWKQNLTSVGLVLVLGSGKNNYDNIVKSTSRVLSEMKAELKCVSFVDGVLLEIQDEISRLHRYYNIVIVCRIESSSGEDDDEIHDTVERAMAGALQKGLQINGASDTGDGSATSDGESDVETSNHCVPQDSVMHCVLLEDNCVLGVLQCENVYMFRSDIDQYNAAITGAVKQILGDRAAKSVSCKVVVKGQPNDLKASFDQLKGVNIESGDDSLSVLTIQGSTQSEVDLTVSTLLKTSAVILRMEL